MSAATVLWQAGVFAALASVVLATASLINKWERRELAKTQPRSWALTLAALAPSVTAVALGLALMPVMPRHIAWQAPFGVVLPSLVYVAVALRRRWRGWFR
jgi:ABC-type spermidine/putrescine transport system permease subunit II